MFSSLDNGKLVHSDMEARLPFADCTRTLERQTECQSDTLPQSAKMVRMFANFQTAGPRDLQPAKHQEMLLRLTTLKRLPRGADSLLDLNARFHKALSIISLIFWKLHFPNKDFDFIKPGNGKGDSLLTDGGRGARKTFTHVWGSSM